MCCRGWTRCPPSGGIWRTGWACRTVCCGPCRRGRPRSGTWLRRRRCRRSPARMRCTCSGTGAWGSTCHARSATRRWSGWPAGTVDDGPGRAPGSVGGVGAAAGRHGVDGGVRRGPARPGGQPPVLDDLTDYQREVVRLRVAHLLEAETGFRSGDPLQPGPGEPRPVYDPRATTLGQRRRAKAAELKALGTGEAALLGLGQVSERTLERMAAAWKDRGPGGCIDGRWVRAGGGHPSVTEEVREAIFAVRAETRNRSRVSMKARCVLIAQYAAEKFGPQVPVPGYWTLREVWREWFGPGGTRPRYDRAAADIGASKVHVVVHRPGQVIALDTTPLPVKVRDGVFGDPVSVHLTLALDLFTHSAAAFRLTLVSDTSVDIAMLLRDVMMPLPMRDGWGPEME